MCNDNIARMTEVHAKPHDSTLQTRCLSHCMKIISKLQQYPKIHKISILSYHDDDDKSDISKSNNSPTMIKSLHAREYKSK